MNHSHMGHMPVMHNSTENSTMSHNHTTTGHDMGNNGHDLGHSDGGGLHSLGHQVSKNHLQS